MEVLNFLFLMWGVFNFYVVQSAFYAFCLGIMPGKPLLIYGFYSSISPSQSFHILNLWNWDVFIITSAQVAVIACLPYIKMCRKWPNSGADLKCCITTCLLFSRVLACGWKWRRGFPAWPVKPSIPPSPLSLSAVGRSSSGSQWWQNRRQRSLGPWKA